MLESVAIFLHQMVGLQHEA